MALNGVERSPSLSQNQTQKRIYQDGVKKSASFHDMLASGNSTKGIAKSEIAQTPSQMLNTDTGIDFSSIRPIVHSESSDAAQSSAGTSGVLTPEQISSLKERYDVQNMSTSELRKLADELAEMGVVSKEVAATTEMRPATPAMTYFICEGQEDPYNQSCRDFLNYFRSGNVLDYLDAAMEESKWSHKMIDDALSGSPYTKLSDNGTNSHTEFKAAITNLQSSHKTLKDVLSQLL